MKMSIFSSGLFWGVLLILGGLSILLKLVFGISFPFFKILFGLLFIYIGIRLILGISNKTENENTMVFGTNRFRYDQNNLEQNIVFSKGLIDYTNADIQSSAKSSKINIVFSEGTMHIDESIPMKIKVSSVFSGTSFPDSTTISFGEYTYTTKAFKDSLPYISVKVDVVFSSFKVKTLN
jgi:predicted membrane protein